MTQKKVSAVVYAVLLVLCIFSLGYLMGINHTSSDIQVVVGESSAIEPQKASESVSQQAEPYRPVNINTADQSLLEALPGIGPELAGRIVAYREENGGFVLPEQIMEVPGIGEKRYESLKDLITVGGIS